MSEYAEPGEGSVNAGIKRAGPAASGAEFETDKSPARLAPPDEVGKGHPPGLWVLFITEMWERFSYYGMRALFVLFLIATTAELFPDGGANSNPGFGWEQKDAYTLYGVYTFMVYLTSIFGGIAADRLLGTHRSMVIGGWIIALGHIVLAGMMFFPHEPGVAVSLSSGPGALLSFLIGCTLIIIGTGFFKPCVSVMVGQLYRENDPRRDSGFTIFYMGINLGGFLAPLVAGSLAKFVGWHWGFGSAAVGMVVGLLFYHAYYPRYLAGVGRAPAGALDARGKGLVALSLAVLLGIPLLPLLLFITGGLDPIVSLWGRFTGWMGVYGMAALITGIVGAAAGLFLFAQRSAERGRIAVILILAFIGNIFFWTAFEQAGSSMNVFAELNTNRPLPLPQAFRDWCQDPGGSGAILMIAGVLVATVALVLRYGLRLARGIAFTTAVWVAFVIGLGVASLGLMKWRFKEALANIGSAHQFPAEWFQSVNSLTILLFAPVFSWLWIWLERRRKNPSTPMKFAIGLWLLGLAFLAMIFGSMQAENSGLAGPHWLLITYVVYTWGELCLSPVGLSMVTKLAPARLQSLMMGLWFFSFALSNLLAGLVARFSVNFVPETPGAEPKMTFIIPGMPGFYLMLVVFPIAAGFFIFAISPFIKKMMRGVK